MIFRRQFSGGLSSWANWKRPCLRWNCASHLAERAWAKISTHPGIRSSPRPYRWIAVGSSNQPVSRRVCVCVCRRSRAYVQIVRSKHPMNKKNIKFQYGFNFIMTHTQTRKSIKLCTLPDIPSCDGIQSPANAIFPTHSTCFGDGLHAIDIRQAQRQVRGAAGLFFRYRVRFVWITHKSFHMKV